jgi:hypothetical protein
MCGRYYSLFDKQQVAEHFHVRRTADNVGIIARTTTSRPVTPSLSFAAAGMRESASW